MGTCGVEQYSCMAWVADVWQGREVKLYFTVACAAFWVTVSRVYYSDLLWPCALSSASCISGVELGCKDETSFCGCGGEREAGRVGCCSVLSSRT